MSGVPPPGRMMAPLTSTTRPREVLSLRVLSTNVKRWCMSALAPPLSPTPPPPLLPLRGENAVAALSRVLLCRRRALLAPSDAAVAAAVPTTLPAAHECRMRYMAFCAADITQQGSGVCSAQACHQNGSCSESVRCFAALHTESTRFTGRAWTAQSSVSEQDGVCFQHRMVHAPSRRTEELRMAPPLEPPR